MEDLYKYELSRQNAPNSLRAVRLLLVRHGESLHSFDGIIAGLTACRGLTERGRGQVQRLAERLSIEGVTGDAGVPVVLNSPVLRARESAEIYAAVGGLEARPPDCDLCELHVGEADGLSAAEYARRLGAFDMLNEPTRVFAPGGESWMGFLDRVESTLNRMASALPDSTVVAFTHAGFIVASMIVLLRLGSPGERAYLDPAYASITEWVHRGSGWWLARYGAT